MFDHILYKNQTLNEPEKKHSSYNFSIILSFIVIFLISQLFIYIAFIIMCIFRGNSIEELQQLMYSKFFILLNLFLTIFEIIIPLFYCLKLEKRSLKSLGFSKNNILKNYFLGIFIGILLFLISISLSVFFGASTLSINSNISFGWIILFFIGFLIQGAGEEILLRGYFLVSLTKKYKIISSIIISSIVFSLLHIFNPGFSLLAFINITLFGIVLSLLFLRYDNIWIVCAIHSAWNFSQGNIFGIKVSGMELLPSIFTTTNNSSLSIINGGTFGLEGGLAVTIVLVITIISIICIKKKPQKH